MYEGGTSMESGGDKPLRALLKISAFFSLAVLISVVAHAAINHGARQITTSQFGVWNKAVGGEIDARIVISGSSRALVHYDAKAIQGITGWSAYNLGQNATRSDLQFAFLKMYLEHNADPRIVVQNLDLHSLALSEEIYIPAQYVPYLDEEGIYSALLNIDDSAWKWRHVPLYGYTVKDMRFTWATGLKGLFGSNPAEDRVLGFNPRDRKWTGEFERFKAANPAGADIEYDAEGIETFESMVNFCTQRGITLVLVYSPEYYEMIPYSNNREQIFSKFREIAVKYDAQFWDYSESALTKRREIFYNSQHLNYKGAYAFSIDLAERLSSLIVARERNLPHIASANGVSTREELK